MMAERSMLVHDMVTKFRRDESQGVLERRLVVGQHLNDNRAVSGQPGAARSFGHNPEALAKPVGCARSGHTGELRIVVTTAKAPKAGDRVDGVLGLTARRDGTHSISSQSKRPAVHKGLTCGYEGA